MKELHILISLTTLDSLTRPSRQPNLLELLQ